MYIFSICGKCVFIFELLGENITEGCQRLSLSAEVMNHFYASVFLFLCSESFLYFCIFIFV